MKKLTFLLFINTKKTTQRYWFRWECL